MLDKECRICGSSFKAKTERRQLCDRCQKNSAKAQSEIDKAINESKFRLGELPNQQYYACLCEYCGKEFHSYGYTRRFCSTTCKEEHSIQTAACPICGKLLLPLGIYCRTVAKCCSDECAEERRFRKARSEGKVVSCKMCAKEFIRKNDWDEFCCKACETNHAIDTARQQGRLAHCKICGKEFIQKTSDKMTCSTACDALHRKSNPAQLIEAKCEICGKIFVRHPNAKQHTCSKQCATVRLKSKAAAKREEMEPNAVSKANQDGANETPDQAQLLKEISNGTITAEEARKLHLCTHCKTTQQSCEWFTSKFSRFPRDTIVSSVAGSNVVLGCPKRT